MRRRLLLTIVFAAALVLAPAAAPQSRPGLDAALAALDKELTADFARDGVGGASIGVVSGSELVWSRHYGYADVEAKRAATNDSAYRIGSITKQFTALALMQLVEDGRMRLADPIEKYVPEIRQIRDARPHAPPITLLQVATMTSGLAREPQCPNHSVGPVSAWQQKVLECLPQTSYALEPGTEYLYSNIGYAALGLAVERAAGRPFIEFVADRTFRPLGMLRSAFEPTPEIRRNLAHGYSRRGNTAPYTREQPDRELDGRGYRVPNGAILSTISDMARFVAWELGSGPESVLKRATQDANYLRVYSATNARDELTMTSGYGLGFQVTRRGEMIALGHGGSTAGYHASALVNRSTKLGVIVLRGCDSCPFDAGPVALRVLQRLVAAVRPQA